MPALDDTADDDETAVKAFDAVLSPAKELSDSSLASVVISQPSFTYCLCLLYTFAVMGLCMGLLGPSLLSFGTQTGSDIGALAYIFTARSVGLFGGTIAGGWLIDKFSNRGHLILAGAVAVLCFVTLIMPFQSSLAACIVLGLIQGVMFGIDDNLSQILLIRHYKDRVGPYMQALHCAFGIGGFLAPLILSPFFADPTITIDTSGTSGTFDPTQQPQPQNGGDVINSTASASWHWAWIIVSAVSAPVVVWVLYYSLRDEFHVKTFDMRSIIKLIKGESITPQHAALSQSQDESASKPPLLSAPSISQIDDAAERLFAYKVVGCVGLFLCLYVGCESGYGSYIYSYSVEHLGISEERSALINSAYWGAFALGRFIGIFVSLYWTAQMMVVVDLCGAIVSVIIIMLWNTSEGALWLGTILYGLFVGSIYASSINYTERLLTVGGRLLAVLTVCAALGDGLLPLSMGAIFSSSVGPIGMMIICAIVAASATAVFAFIVLVIAKEQRGKNKLRAQSSAIHTDEIDFAVSAQEKAMTEEVKQRSALIDSDFAQDEDDDANIDDDEYESDDEYDDDESDLIVTTQLK